MSILNVEILKKIIENVPEDYTVEYENEHTIAPLVDKVEIDVGNKRIVLKK